MNNLSFVTAARETSAVSIAGHISTVEFGASRRVRVRGNANTGIRFLFWLFLIVVGAAQAWNARNTMATDGISYLDMGSAFAHGHPEALINGYWSPLYPALIGTALSIAHPEPKYEFAAVHAVNFLIFVFALACAEFLLQSVIATCKLRQACPPSWFLRILGYTVVAWALLDLITVGVTSPDMLLAGFAFLAAGMFVRIAAGSVSWLHFAGLGAILGLGYIAKAPLFPLAFVFLIGTFLVARKLNVPLRRSLAAAAAFLITASPLVILLSLNKHRLSFGDSGRLNYAWYVDGAAYRHWQGAPLGGHEEVAPHWTAGPVSSGIPAHPTRKILDTSAGPVFQFDRPDGGTYPVWYDPSYWNEGLRAPFNLGQQLRKLRTNGKFMYSLFLNLHAVQLVREGKVYLLFSPVVLGIWALLICFGARLRLRSSLWPIMIPLVMPALAALCMYVVVYSEPRHLAPFITLLDVGLFAALSAQTLSPSVIKSVAVALVVGFLATVGVSGGQSVASTVRSLSRGTEPPPVDWQVVEGLRQMGIRENTKVASLNYSNHDHVRWAKLAHDRIVAELFPGAYSPSEDNYWSADPATRQQILDAFARAGADIVVSKRLPQVAPPAGWIKIGQTPYYVYRIPHA